ncbi:uncharacterized protein LOC129180496 isoform X2 [Dunckerocampus dactyliophorus]|uniref:uncharacterized protein LOC129180496 isoform X2 n=1 Tax=Dunckerocampus dactyliophorus TaxID=161453 RepID=UPI002406F995|nr:uncharacterized protein LOC129180496 isoform X2 [Dunckerocampus dactyliophorus]
MNDCYTKMATSSQREGGRESAPPTPSKSSMEKKPQTADNDAQQLIDHQEEHPTRLQGGDSTLKQEDPQSPHIKEEEEELRITQEAEGLLCLEEAELTKLPLTGVSMKTEDHEDKPPESSCWLCPSDVQQMIGRQEERPPQPQRWISTLKQEAGGVPATHVKQEKEELWVTQERQHLLRSEEADPPKLPLTGVSVKTEDHEDKPPESSQLHHSPSEEKRGAEPPSSSSPQHMTTEADGDHCGESQADNLLAPLSDSEDEDRDNAQEPLSNNTNWEGDMRPHADNKYSERSKKDPETKMPKVYSTQQALDMILNQVNPCDSDGEDIALQPSSDSEISSDEETLPPPEKRGRLEKHTGPTEKAKDGTVWREEQVGRPLHHSPIESYAADGELTALVRKRVSSRLQSFLCFVTLDMLRTIQEWTVEHGRQTQHESWFVALPELMAFIAILLFRGVIKLPSLRDAWSAKLGQPLIVAIMARNRFQDIMRHLRFDDKDTRSERVGTDRFAAVSDVWGSFVSNCITSYNPGRYITIDEQLFPTKSRCCFLQYIATKPDKFGIKFWVACDLKSKYVCNVIPYLGKDPSRPTGERLSDNVVMKLMEPFMDKGRTVTTDDFFTSLSLAQRLLMRKTTLLGTVNKMRRELPESAKKNLDHNKFSTRVFSTSGATLTVYAPKRRKTVCVLSSMHSVVETGDTRKKKPNTVTDYNSKKCGVDVMDQMVGEFSVRSGTRRWPVAVFYNMIDIAALNAHALYQACTGVKERRVDFLVELASELAQPHLGAKKANKDTLLRQQPPTPGQGKRAMCQVNCRCKNNHATVRCVDCYKYTCGKCRKEMVWQCQVCSDNIQQGSQTQFTWGSLDIWSE